MVARFLVTTALEDTWPADDAPVLFLGEWCRLYGRKSAWEKRDAIVAPYHWDNRQKLYRDYLYLQALYEELLKELATQLNSVHRVDRSLRYWRILVGPWLGYFVQMLFDRWAMLRQVVSDSDISGVRVLRHNDNQLVPNDMARFVDLFVDDVWNESIYGLILDWMDVPLERIESKHSENKFLSCLNKLSSAHRLKRGMAKVVDHISGVLCRDTDYFFISSYLGVKQDLLLQGKLGQLPKLWRRVATPDCAFDSAARQWKLPKAECNDAFATLARALIPNQIPKAYVEGYRELVSLIENLPWPQRPRAIFTSGSFNSDDVFKAWAATKVESGTPLIIGQHGGNFGMAKWSFLEEHQIAIADRFLTWGWGESEKNNIKPIGNIKGFGRPSVADKAGVALLVETTIPRQSYWMFSAPVAAAQWNAYFEEQCRFVQALPVRLRNQLLVRLYSTDYGYGQPQRWQSRFPDIHLDLGNLPMSTLLKKSRIFISTYNATTYLESLSINFPTIIFWNPEHWELRENALPFFKKLKSVGIFHESPESAARQMAEVWDNVSSWWQSAEVQSVRQEFCDQYAHMTEDLLNAMEKLFRYIAANKSASVNAEHFNANKQ